MSKKTNGRFTPSKQRTKKEPKPLKFHIAVPIAITKKAIGEQAAEVINFMLANVGKGVLLEGKDKKFIAEVHKKVTETLNDLHKLQPGQD